MKLKHMVQRGEGGSNCTAAAGMGMEGMLGYSKASSNVLFGPEFGPPTCSAEGKLERILDL